MGFFYSIAFCYSFLQERAPNLHSHPEPLHKEWDHSLLKRLWKNNWKQRDIGGKGDWSNKIKIVLKQEITSSETPKSKPQKRWDGGTDWSGTWWPVLQKQSAIRRGSVGSKRHSAARADSSSHRNTTLTPHLNHTPLNSPAHMPTAV